MNIGTGSIWIYIVTLKTLTIILYCKKMFNLSDSLEWHHKFWGFLLYIGIFATLMGRNKDKLYYIDFVNPNTTQLYIHTVEISTTFLHKLCSKFAKNGSKHLNFTPEHHLCEYFQKIWAQIYSGKILATATQNHSNPL